jgi:hypothetical protein
MHLFNIEAEYSPFLEKEIMYHLYKGPREEWWCSVDVGVL